MPGRSRRKADEARLFSRPHPRPFRISKGPIQSGDRSGISGSTRHSRPAAIPRPERAHFSYGAAADECSILGIIAAAFTAEKYPETVSWRALILIRFSIQG